MRDAATVLLVRDEPRPEGGSELQVFMVRRHAGSGFVGGHHVFPGGVVDAEDRDPAWAERCGGSVDPFAIAAVREVLEEAAILLARNRSTGTAVSMGSEDVGRLAKQVHSGAVGFLDACRREDLDLRVDDLIRWSHWITPEGEPRRYNTHFFVAVAPPDQEAIHDELELTEGKWSSPGDFLDQHRAGQIQMILPTVATLRSIEHLGSTEELLLAASARGPITPTAPEMRREDDGSISILVDGEHVWTMQAER